METITSLLSYIFDPTPGPDFRYTWPLLIVGALLIIAAIAFNTHYKRKKKKGDLAFKKLFKNASTHMFTFGVLILILTSIRYENIPYFAMRLWFIITILTLIYYAYKYVKAAYKDYPQMKAANAHKASNQPSKKVKTYSASKKRR